MVLTKVFSEGEFVEDVTFAQITTSTTTPSVGVSGLRNHSFQIAAVGINAIGVQGSLDDTNWFTVPIEDGATTNWAAGVGNVFINNLDGTFTLGINDLAVNFIRLNVGSVGTSVDAVYHGEI